MSIYNLITLNRAVQARQYTGSFFLTKFFKKETPSATKTIEVDIIKAGGRKLAPVVSPILGGVVMRKDGYETKTLTPPYLHPKDVITVDDLGKRSAGESPYAPIMSQEQRQAKTAAEYIAKLDNTIERRKEYMAAQAVINGEIRLKRADDKSEYLVSFGRAETHKITLSGTAAWGKSAASITGDLRSWKRLISKDSGYNADTLILGFAAIKPFFSDPEIKTFFSAAGYNVAQLLGTNVADGVTYYGRVPEFGDIYSYNEFYYDEEKKETVPLMPDDMVLYGASEADNRLYHGAIHNMHAGEGLVALEKFVDSFMYENGKGREISIESAPLPTLTMPDAFVAAKVI